MSVFLSVSAASPPTDLGCLCCVCCVCTCVCGCGLRASSPSRLRDGDRLRGTTPTLVLRDPWPMVLTVPLGFPCICWSSCGERIWWEVEVGGPTPPCWGPWCWGCPWGWDQSWGGALAHREVVVTVGAQQDPGGRQGATAAAGRGKGPTPLGVFRDLVERHWV